MRYALPESVGDEFVGRREELAYLRRIIGRAPRRMAYSIALIARKGMGKTALMQRFFNLLFFDRDFGVAPIYLSLGEYRAGKREGRTVPQLTVRGFCELYFKTYVHHLLAYHTGDAELMLRKGLDLPQLAALAEERGQTDLAADALEIDRRLESGRYLLPDILTWPPMRAYRLKEPHVYMIDEFQIVHDLYTDDKQGVVSIKDSFQTVAEARWAPMIVSGSIVSLINEVVMTGLLARRFQRHTLRELPTDEARQQIEYLSQMQAVPVSEAVKDAIVARTGGHPFYIWIILNSSALARQPDALTNLVGLDRVMDYEMTGLDAHLRLYWLENFQNHLARVNSGGLGEAILYWIASGEIEGEATPYKLVPLLRANRFDQVSEREVVAKLRDLYEIDLLMKGLGMHGYEGLRDPIMDEFIHRNYYSNILRWSDREIENSWRRRYYELLGKTNYFKGRVAETYVREAMRAFDGQEVDGKTYFGVAGQVSLSAFADVRLRGGTMLDGKPVEIDVLGEGEQVWLVEVKYRVDPMEKGEVETFVERAAQVAAEYGYEQPVLWVVSRTGFTGPVEPLLAEQGVLCSDVAQFNALARLLETLLLPE